MNSVIYSLTGVLGQGVGAISAGGGEGPPVSENLLSHLNAEAIVDKADNEALATGYVWADQSGNGNDWTHRGGGNACRWRSILGPNGRPALYFPDTGTLNDALGPHFDRASLGGGLTQLECFVMLKLDADAPAQSWQTGLWQLGTDTANVDHWPWTDGTVYAGPFLNTRQTMTNPAASFTGWVVIDVSFAANGDYNIYINDALYYAGGIKTMAFPATWRLGRAINNASNNYYPKGFISEFLFYNKSMSAGERTAIYEYLTR